MLRKLRKTVREKLDHVDSRLSSPQDDASVGQPGSHIVSRDGGGLQPADFPTQTDFFKFRKQCWNAGLQIAPFGKLTHPGKVTSTSPGEHMPERFCRTIGEIGSLKVTGPGLLKQESTPSVFR
jgi:hypothetical protein